MNWVDGKGPAPCLRDGLMAGGAPAMWDRVLKDALHDMRHLVPAGSRVLEVGYGDGLLSCWLSREHGWLMTGLDMSSESQMTARGHAARFALSDCTRFECCRPEDTWSHTGQYDAVFIKTVLYNACTLDEYGQWLDWVLSVLRPGGVLINFETGKANAFTQWYRRLRGRIYKDLSLYTGLVEMLYDSRFEILYRRYYGGWSQFLAPLPFLYSFCASVEEGIQERDADNCFAVGMIGRKRS